jgi:hypothetical protein
VTYEEVYRADHDSPRAAHHGIAHYVEFENDRRPYQALADQTLAEVDVASPTPDQLLTTMATTI